jgi:hypothetical protein
MAFTYLTLARTGKYILKAIKTQANICNKLNQSKQHSKAIIIPANIG